MLMDFRLQDLGSPSVGCLGSSPIPHFIQIFWLFSAGGLVCSSLGSSTSLPEVDSESLSHKGAQLSSTSMPPHELLTHLFVVSFIPGINIFMVENIPKFEILALSFTSYVTSDMLPKLRTGSPHLYIRDGNTKGLLPNAALKLNVIMYMN